MTFLLILFSRPLHCYSNDLGLDTVTHPVLASLLPSFLLLSWMPWIDSRPSCHRHLARGDPHFVATRESAVSRALPLQFPADIHLLSFPNIPVVSKSVFEPVIHAPRAQMRSVHCYGLQIRSGWRSPEITRSCPWTLSLLPSVIMELSLSIPFPRHFGGCILPGVWLLLSATVVICCAVPECFRIKLKVVNGARGSKCESVLLGYTFRKRVLWESCLLTADTSVFFQRWSHHIQTLCAVRPTVLRNQHYLRLPFR